jgi:predicted amidohydrolase YtcJ
MMNRPEERVQITLGASLEWCEGHRSQLEQPETTCLTFHQGDNLLSPGPATKAFDMPNPKRLLIRGGQVYDHDGDVHKPPLADVLIEDGMIIEVRPNLATENVHEVIDARDRLVVPGLINAHYHSHDTLCRGLFEELPLEMWLLYTLPMGANRSKEELRARTLVGAVESLRCGITTVQDMLGLVPLDEASTDIVIEAYRDAGIRVVFSPMVWDIPPIAMVRNKDSLPPDVPGDAGRHGAAGTRSAQVSRAPVQQAPWEGHPALGDRSVRPAALHAEDASGLRRPRPQARSSGLHPRL